MNNTQNILFVGRKAMEFIMKINVCIGSSCHVKGSRQVVEQLRNLIDDNNLTESVELAGIFCMGKCQDGVCVTMEDKLFSVTPENVTEFFNDNVMAALK